MASPPQRPADADGQLWFSPPDSPGIRRRALGMRALAARLGVVPAALYRYVRSKEQLCDLVVDEVLAEVGSEAGPDLAWTEQVKVLLGRLRTVRPGTGCTTSSAPCLPTSSPS